MSPATTFGIGQICRGLIQIIYYARVFSCNDCPLAAKWRNNVVIHVRWPLAVAAILRVLKRT